MRIELEEPYKSLYRAAYLNTGTDGRKRVWFTNEEGVTVFGTAYARYLMSVKLGYIVPDDYEVDHRDDDFTNDDISNLQLLTKQQNRVKQEYKFTMSQPTYGYHCAWCTTAFLLTETEVMTRDAKGVTDAFCSQRCSARFLADRKGSDPDKISRIGELRRQGFLTSQIAEQTGWSEATIKRYVVKFNL